MTGATQDRAKRRAAAAGASLLLHAGVLTWLGLRAAPDLATAAPPPETPPFAVELVREPRAQAAAPATPALRATPVRPRAALPVPALEAPVPPRPRPARPVPPQALTPPPLPIRPVPSPGRSASTAPSIAAPAAAPPSAPVARAAPGPLPGAEGAADLRGLLRATVGCSHEFYMTLSPAERARCDQGFAAARNAPRILPPDDKLAAFALQADANARRMRQKEGSLPNAFVACDPAMAGSNLVGNCLPPEAMHTVRKF